MANDKNKYDLLQENIDITTGYEYTITKKGNNSNLVEIIGRYNPTQKIYEYLKSSSSQTIGLFTKMTGTSIPILSSSYIGFPISIKVKNLICSAGVDHSRLLPNNLPNGNYHGNLIIIDDDSGEHQNEYVTGVRLIVGITRELATSLIDAIDKGSSPSNYGIYINYRVIGEL